MGFFEPNIKKQIEKKNVDGLIKSLQYKKNCSVRRDAAKALGSIKDTRAVEPLVAALKDEDEDVREYAAEALKSIGDTRAVEPLITALQDKSFYVRRDAAKALGSIKDTRAVEPLVAALKDEDEDVREYAAEALKSIGDTRAVVPLVTAAKNEDEVDSLVKQLAYMDENVRRNVADYLAKLGEPKWLDYIQGNDDDFIRLVKSKDSRLLVPLLYAAIYIRQNHESWGGGPLFNKVVDMLSEDKDLVMPLIKILVGENDSQLRCLAADCLGLSGDLRAVEPLISMLNNSNDDLQAIAARNLGKLKDSRAIEHLEKIRKVDFWCKRYRCW